MKILKIKTEKRTELGKTANRKLRKQDRIPGVLYGGEKVLHFHMFRNDLRHLLFTPEVFFVELEIEGKTYRAIKQEAQFHPVTDQVLHVDFLEIFDGKPVAMNIPLRIEGQSVGVKKGGVLKQDMRYILMKGIPSVLPEKVVVDITDLDIGNSLKIADLDVKDVEFLVNEDVSIVGVVAARGLAEEEEEDEEGEEGEEGEDSEGADAEASEEKAE
jgi:large subunit ribosomal protein L25